MKSKYRKFTDRELVEGMLQGDSHAFAEIYNRYFGVIYSFVRRMAQDDELAEDITQEIFLALYENAIHTKILKLRSYLYQSARYALIDYARKERTRNSYMDGLNAYYMTGDWSTDETVTLRELERLIEQEVDKLPVKMRTIFELSRKHYLSNKEIAKNLNLSEGTVRQQIHNALVRLRLRLSCYLVFVIHLLFSDHLR